MPSRTARVSRTLAQHALRASWQTFTCRDEPGRAWARETRRAMEALGPTFVKLGQLASVRPDLIPPTWTSELEHLQDDVAPMPTAVLQDTLRSALGARATHAFDSFGTSPVASGSVAQVHVATLRDPYQPVGGATLAAGTRVAVKVLRPGITATINADVRLARRVVRTLGNWPAVRRWRLAALIDELDASLQRETDLRIEGRSADHLAHAFEDDPYVVVPRTVWPLTTRHVLVNEYLDGWRLRDAVHAERAGIDTHALARHGANAFLRQVVTLGLFHADLHPANLLITRDGRIGYVDFGITGTTTSAQRAAIARLLLATATMDEEAALHASHDPGLRVPADCEAHVRREIRRLLDEHVRNRSPSDLRGFAWGFVTLLHRERITIPEGYGLLVKSLVTVEGVARALYPDMDVVQAVLPTATRAALDAALREGPLLLRGLRLLREGRFPGDGWFVRDAFANGTPPPAR